MALHFFMSSHPNASGLNNEIYMYTYTVRCFLIFAEGKIRNVTELGEMP